MILLLEIRNIVHVCLQRDGILDEWNDRHIGAGEDWNQKTTSVKDRRVSVARANAAAVTDFPTPPIS